MDDILYKLSLEDPRFTHIDLRKIDVDDKALEEIAEKLEINTAVIRVSWKQEYHYNPPLKKWIEKKVELNYKKFQRYPSDFILGLFSCHVYTAPKENCAVEFPPNSGLPTVEALSEELKNWNVFKTYGSPEFGRYYSVAYVNDAKKQLVLSHRGNELKIWDFASRESPLREDLGGILDGKIVKQQWEAYVATEKVVKYAKMNEYTVSFTGQALGAWLAELSIYFAASDFNFRSKAVTFDSPGSASTMVSFELEENRAGNNPVIEKLDITSYLSAPNLVNSCNAHLGKVYRIFPDIAWIDFTNRVRSILKKIPIAKHFELVLMSLMSTDGHRVDRVVAAFDHVTGKPKTFEKVLNWPCFQYESKVTITVENVIHNTQTSILSLCKLLPGIGWLAFEAFSKPTLFTVLKAFDKFVYGDIDIQEFQTVCASLEIISKRGGEPVPIISDEKFSIEYEGQYSTRELDSLKDYHVTPKSKDWYLNELYKLSFNEIDGMDFEDYLKVELKQLRSRFKIKSEQGSSTKYVLVNSPDVNIDTLREKIVGLCEKYPEVVEIFGNKYAYLPQHKTLSQSWIVSSNLPPRLSNFLERPKVMEEIEKVLDKHKFVAISGLCGTGKSTIAVEYGRDLWEKSNRQIVRIIDADCPRKINTAYKEIAKTCLGVNVQNQMASNVMQSVHNGIEKSGCPVLFIFNNVEKYGDVEVYLGGISKMKTVKVIITSRHNDLSEKLQNINLSHFTREEAKLYVLSAMGDTFSLEAVEKIVENFAGETRFLPFNLSLNVEYLKQISSHKLGRCVDDLGKSDCETGTSLLLDLIVRTSELPWVILQYSAYLDPDFISTEIFKELLHKDSSELLVAFKKLEGLGLISLRRQNSESGLKLHRLLQDSVRKYVHKNEGLISVIDTLIIFERTLEVLCKFSQKDTLIMDHQLVHVINGFLRWLKAFSNIASGTHIFAERTKRAIDKISGSGPPIKSYVGAAGSIPRTGANRGSLSQQVGWSEDNYLPWFKNLATFINRATCTEGGFILGLGGLVEEAVESHDQMFQRYPNDFVLGLLSCHAYTDAMKDASVKFPFNSGVADAEAWNEDLRSWTVFEVYDNFESGYCSVAYLNEEKRQMVLAHHDIVLELWDLEECKSQTNSRTKLRDSLSGKSTSWTDLVGILDGKVRKLLEQASAATGEVIKHAKESGFTVAFTGHLLGAYLAEFSFARAHDSCFRCKAVTFDKPKLPHSDISFVLSYYNKNNDIQHSWQYDKLLEEFK